MTTTALSNRTKGVLGLVAMGAAGLVGSKLYKNKIEKDTRKETINTINEFQGGSGARTPQIVVSPPKDSFEPRKASD